MLIGGLQQTTLLDYPGKVAAVVFTQGCNFLCPYCHNPDLVCCRRDPLALADVLAFLTRRKRVLEGIVISGGEPTLHEDLFPFCATAKSLGYVLKLDTNGSRPDVLRELLRAKLVDYVAMDVKGDPRDYPPEMAVNLGDAVARSMALLCEGGIAHEFRIPCAAPFINAASFAAIVAEVGQAPMFLQQIRLGDVLCPEFFEQEGRALTLPEMEDLRQSALRDGVDCRMR
jgi:pyruvate formate lyase activating enzyme